MNIGIISICREHKFEDMRGRVAPEDFCRICPMTDGYDTYSYPTHRFLFSELQQLKRQMDTSQGRTLVLDIYPISGYMKLHLQLPLAN